MTTTCKLFCRNWQCLIQGYDSSSKPFPPLPDEIEETHQLTIRWVHGTLPSATSTEHMLALKLLELSLWDVVLVQSVCFLSTSWLPHDI
jgi:hypothetical protein